VGEIVKREVTGGGVPPPLGPGGCALGDFSNYRCMQVSSGAFFNKNQHIDACKPVNFGKLYKL
jgi:hypothetical protein